MTVLQKRPVIVGATGMVGGEALRYAVDAIFGSNGFGDAVECAINLA